MDSSVSTRILIVPFDCDVKLEMWWLQNVRTLYCDHHNLKNSQASLHHHHHNDLGENKGPRMQMAEGEYLRLVQNEFNQIYVLLDVYKCMQWYLSANYWFYR